MVQFGFYRLMKEAAGDDEDALMKPLNDEYIQHILARHLIHSPAQTASNTDSSMPTLKNEGLHMSGGDFREDNMYYFEGKDHTKVVNTKTQDAEWLKKLWKEAATSTKRQTKASRKRFELVDDDEGDENDKHGIEFEAEQARQRDERRQKALLRKFAQWDANKYTSVAMKPKDGLVPLSPREFDSKSHLRNIGRLYYKSGDASHPPLASIQSSPYIIGHCVDNSGVWCSRGFFRSLSALSPVIQKQYEAAGCNNDLKLGSAHLVRLPADNNNAPFAGYVCLLVVQGFTGKKKERVGKNPGTLFCVRQGKSSIFRLNALETALQALAHCALEMGATLHLPRIGYGTPNFNWYAVERLLIRNLRDVGVEATMYYYSRSGHS